MINHMSSTLTMAKFMSVYMPFHLLTANLLLDRVYSRILSNMAKEFLDLNFTLLIIIRLGK